MAKIATLPAPDKDELDWATKREKREAQTKAQREKLDKRDILLQSIPPLPEYQPMKIEDRAAVSHLPFDQGIIPYIVFSHVWTARVWEMLCENINLYASVQETIDPSWVPTTMSELKVFVAITIYMGIFHFSTIHDYWRTNGIAPVAPILVEKMAQNRYVLLFIYFFISVCSQRL